MFLGRIVQPMATKGKPMSDKQKVAHLVRAMQESLLIIEVASASADSAGHERTAAALRETAQRHRAAIAKVAA